MSPKTIWIINQYAGSPLHGMEFRHYYLAKEFVKAGNKVLIISGSYSHLYKKQPTITGDFTFETIDGISYCWVKVPSYERSTSLARFRNMREFAGMLGKFPLDKVVKPDTIIVSSPSLFPIVRAKKWAKQFSAKLIFEVRDIWPLTLQELAGLSGWHPLVMFMRWYEKFAYRKSDCIVSVLPGAHLHISSYGIPENGITCIPNGIDLEEVAHPVPLDTSVAEKLPSGKFIVGYAGSIGLSNGLDAFVEAAVKMKEESGIAFVVVGNGGEKGKLRKKTEGCENVLFLDSVPKDQFQSLLARFDCCYIGWRKESLYRFGISANKLFDYMYAAKPVIHSVEAYNDPVADAGAGISVVPENAQAIVNAVGLLKGMSVEERRVKGSKGKAYVTAHHTYSALAAQYLDLIR